MKAFVAAVGLALAGVSATAEPLRIVTQSIPETRGNPHSYSGLPLALVNQAIFEPLIRIEADGVLRPGLAAAWTQESRLTWTVTLQDNVKFSDGEPFDAAAVAAAFNYLLGDPIAPDLLAASSIRAKIGRVEARDRLTVEFSTKVVDPILPIHIANVRIPAPAAWAKGPDTFSGAPVGTGPYRVIAWTPADVRMVRNDLARSPGAAAELSIRALPDQSARAQALSSGSADIAMDISVDAAFADTGVGFRIVPRTATMITFIQFVTVGDSPVKDVRVRRALNYAVDKTKLIAAFLGGAAEPATQFTHPGAFGFNNELAPYPYDPEMARRLLAEAGYDGRQALSIVFVGGAGQDAAIYQQIAADLARVGVAAEFRPITISTWMGHLQAGDWPGFAFVTGIQGNDPLQAFTTRSCQWPKPHHCDLEVLPMLAEARAAETESDMRTRTQRLMAHENDNPPGLLLWPRVAFDGLGPRVANFVTGQDRVLFDRLTVRE